MANTLSIKRKASDILGRISIVAIFAGCVEGLDGGLTAWTLICLAVAFVTGIISKRLCDPPCMHAKTPTP